MDNENSIYALKTATGQERNVASLLAGKIKDSSIEVNAVLVPEALKGYILIEASSKIDLQDHAFKSIPRHLFRGMVESKSASAPNTVSFEEVKKFLKPEPIISSIKEGSIVELVSGPFKAEKAKVIRIGESKEEVVLELIEAAVPIPVTVKADQIRIIKKEAD